MRPMVQRWTPLSPIGGVLRVPIHESPMISARIINTFFNHLFNILQPVLLVLVCLGQDTIGHLTS